MHKRGQVTTFVIIGIIVIILVAFVLFYRFSPRLAPGTESSNNIQEFTESCIQTTGRDALIRIGYQGGYNTVPDDAEPIHQNSETYGEYDIAHWMYGSEDYVPSYDRIEQELNAYFVDHLNDCLKDYESFTSNGWSVSATAPITIDVTFDYGQTTFAATYPISATKGSQRFDMETYDPVTIPFDTRGIIDTAQTTARMFGNSRQIPVAYVKGQGYGFYTANAGGGSTLFRLSSEQNNEEKHYVWIFAAQ